MAELNDAPLFAPSEQPRADRPFFGGEEDRPLFTDAQKRVAPQPKELPLEQYKEMPWSNVLSRARGELGPSAARSLMAIPSAIYNYPETGHALKQAFYGGLGAAGLRREKDPAQRAEQEAMFGAMVEPVTASYQAIKGDPTRLKKLVAEDPFSVLTTAATPFGGGLAKAGELVGEASLIGRGLTGAGKISRYAMDPTQAVMGVAGDIGAKGLEKISQIRDVSTNVPRFSYEKAVEAGALPAGDIGKAAFNDFMSGQGDAVEFSRRASKATEALRNQAMQDWISTKGAMTGAHTQPLSYQKTLDAIKNARAELTPRKIALQSDLAAHDALDQLERNIASRRLNYPDPQDPIHTLQGFDRLKQNFWDFANDETKGRADRNAALAAYHGLKETIYDAAPEYAKLMDQYQAIDDQIKNIQKTLGTTNKTAANAEIAKFIKAQKTPEGRDLISQIAQHDPVIPFMTAGSTLHSNLASGVPGALEKGSLPLHALNIAAGVLTSNPFHAVSAMGLAGAQAALQSPALMGELAYRSGQIGATRPAKIVKKIPKAVRVAQPAATSLVRARPQIEKGIIGSVEPMEEERPYFPGPEEREGRATGGSVKRGLTAQMLMAAVERAKANGQKRTESILNAPDEHVVKALKVANESI